MNSDDPLIRFLQAADAASALPGSSEDLPHRVRARCAQQMSRSKRLKIGSSAIAVVAIALVASLQPLQPIAHSLPDAEITQLRAQSDQLAAEADALERQLGRIKSQEIRLQLSQEHTSQLLAAASDQLSPLDRAALVGISQGDFYRDIRQSLDEAKTSYESVLADFPDTRWASVAQSRIDLLLMN